MADYQVPAIPGMNDAPPDLSAAGVANFLDNLSKDATPEARAASHDAMPTTLTGNETVAPPAAPRAISSINEATGVSLLNDVLGAQQQQTQIQAKASGQITDIINTNQVAQDEAYDAILKAQGNQEKINTLGGPDSPLVKVLSIFDHSYSTVDNQIAIKSAGVRAEQAATRAKTMTDLASQGPASAAIATQLAKENYTLYSDARKNFVADAQLANERDKTNIEAARLMLQIPKDQRDQVREMVDRLPTQVVASELNKINKGQASPYTPIAGLLKKRLDSEQQAELGVQQTRNAVIRGDRENAVEGMKTTLLNLPDVLVKSAIDAANKAGSPEITIGKMKFPTTLAMDAYNHTQQTRQDYDARATEELSHVAQIPARAQQLTGALSMLSGSTSMAPVELRLLNNQLAGADTKTYDGIQQASAYIDSSKKRVDALAKEVADQFKSPEAKAAVIGAANNGGQFDKPGADAVVGEALGNLPTQSGTLLQPVYSFLNSQFKIALNPKLTALTSRTADIGQLMSMFQKDTLDMSRTKVLTDPDVRAKEASIIEPIIQYKGLVAAAQTLAAAKGADPVFTQLVRDNYKGFRKPDGNFDLGAAVSYLTRQGASTGIDYVGAIQTQLESQLADNPLKYDSQLTLTDRAELARIYGQDAHGSIMNGFIRSYRGYAATAQQDFQDAVARDKANTATLAPDYIREQYPEAVFSPAPGLNDPSATGVPGWTVGDVIRRYGPPPVPAKTGRK